MPSKTDFHGDGGGAGGPRKKCNHQTWREINDAKYLDKVVDYDKSHHKRYRSDSEDTVENTEMPAPKRFKESPRYWDNSEESSSSIDSEKSPIKRYRSDSDESDYSHETKKYKKELHVDDENRPIKGCRSETDSDDDCLPTPKRGRKDEISGGKRQISNEYDGDNENEGNS